MNKRALLCFRQVRDTPYFSAYFIGDCRYRMFCVILFMKNLSASSGMLFSHFNYFNQNRRALILDSFFAQLAIVFAIV